MKKLLISVFLIVLSMFCSPVFSANQNSDGYGAITTNMKHFNNPKDIIFQAFKMEGNFNDFLSDKKSKQKNSKLFGLYMKNMLTLVDNFGEVWRNVEYGPENYGLYIKYNGVNDEEYFYGSECDISYYYTEPEVNAAYVRKDGDYLFLTLNYTNLNDTYAQHLNKTWSTYLEYKKIEQIEYNQFFADYGDNTEDEKYDEIYTKLDIKWIKKWIVFSMFHPNFVLNKQIHDDISLKSIARDFNVDIYKFIIIASILLPLFLFGISVFLIRKFNLIITTKTLILNILAYLKSFVIRYKKILVVVIGLIVAILIFIPIHNATSLPKCDSSYAEDTVMRIFKNNEKEYKRNAENVGTLIVKSIVPESYDKEIGKYTCSATIEMQAMPESYLYSWWGGRFSALIYDVSYSIYKEKGENTVMASWSANYRKSIP